MHRDFQRTVYERCIAVLVEPLCTPKTDTRVRQDRLQHVLDLLAICVSRHGMFHACRVFLITNAIIPKATQLIGKVSGIITLGLSCVIPPPQALNNYGLTRPFFAWRRRNDSGGEALARNRWSEERVLQ